MRTRPSDLQLATMGEQEEFTFGLGACLLCDLLPWCLRVAMEDMWIVFSLATQPGGTPLLALRGSHLGSLGMYRPGHKNQVLTVVRRRRVQWVKHAEGTIGSPSIRYEDPERDCLQDEERKRNLRERDCQYPM